MLGKLVHMSNSFIYVIVRSWSIKIRWVQLLLSSRSGGIQVENLVSPIYGKLGDVILINRLLMLRKHLKYLLIVYIFLP